ncbi:conserved hypothetical protein [Talaromyces stipitatus ATCC 10500]|uniref:Uncharacterized protein n=1 Tax=Talaromyces stipitatus (strain ATCC 10500 / CBS 375.48 / QM 6759 / NRRL 1006) TaxID=441959 RepID=B8MG78_TALSN|nr:uncharacterized protein TSTA_010610 [Talaromyces stipitatus ATCC 10500]EED15945.1 conserved hypothetical protein [Talaromyces stipitatus ATCC 10500]
MDKEGDKSSSRLPTSRTFPVNIHHRHHRSEVTRPSDYTQTSQDQTRNGTEERQPWTRRLFVDTSDLEPSSSNEKTSNKNGEGHAKSHKYSKSKDHRLPRAVNQIASAGGARNLLPNRPSFHRHTQSHGYPYLGGDRDAEYSFLKPIPSNQDSSRPIFRSRSSSVQRNGGSQAASFVVTEEEDNEAMNRRLSLTTTRGREIKTAEDLSLARHEREKGEEILRSKLASIGTLATDITRRLDYTYYNLLERISTLHLTINTFQELVDSSVALHENFQRDNSNLESDIRKQLADFAKFDPQRQRIDELESRMKAGKAKMEDLGNRLDKVRQEIEGWERREGEWQARVSRRLRVLGGFLGGLVLVIIVAYIVRFTSTSMSSSVEHLDSKIDTSSQSLSDTHSTDVHVDVKTFLKSPLLTKHSPEANTDKIEHPSANIHSHQSHPPDPLRLFDEL